MNQERPLHIDLANAKAQANDREQQYTTRPFAGMVHCPKDEGHKDLCVENCLYCPWNEWHAT